MNEWICFYCGAINRAGKDHCEDCGAARLKIPHATPDWTYRPQPYVPSYPYPYVPYWGYPWWYYGTVVYTGNVPYTLSTNSPSGIKP